jgi:4-hydroxy-4-methyl-2-oxoglutarate aldolase
LDPTEGSETIARRNFLQGAGLVGLAGIAGGLPAAVGADRPAAPKIPDEGRLTPEEIAYLQRWDSPTVSNALERTKVRPATAGFMGPAVRSIFPEFGVMVGYAVTATIKASEPAKEGRYVDRFEYYEYIQSIPSPRVMVIHDEDAPHPVGSFWGEVHGNLHRALGCVGVVTDGGVRDLAPVRALRFHYFAAEVLVSHAHVHLVDFGKPVEVGGLQVEPGALLYGDEHGVIEIPHALAKKVGPLCYDVFMSERPFIDFCQSGNFSLEKLREFLKPH